MSHLLFIFRHGLRGRGFLLWEAHSQARDELPGQGAPGEGWGQDGEAVEQQQALQCVLAAGPGGAGPMLLPCQPLLAKPKWVLDAAKGWWEEASGILPPPRQPLAKHSLQFLTASPAIRNRKSR